MTFGLRHSDLRTAVIAEEADEKISEIDSGGNGDVHVLRTLLQISGRNLAPAS